MRLTTLISLLATVLVFWNCTNDELNAPRKEVVEIHALADCSDKPLTGFCINVREGSSKLYLKTDVSDFEVFWQDAAERPWVTVKSCENTSVKGVWAITLEYDARLEDVTYARRTGYLSITKADANLGLFFPVYQGAVVRTENDFSSFLYGSWVPTDFREETLIKDWSTTQLELGFASDPVAPSEEAVCIAKNGMLKIGDAEGNRGSLLTPLNANHVYDSLLMITFKAAAFKDDIKDFKVEVIGGGVLKDFLSTGGTSLELTAPYIVEDAVVERRLWPAESNFIIFIESTPSSRIGVNTRLKITSGSSSKTGNSRLFIDDFCEMKLVDGLDIEYYNMNQGSGQDKILAVRNN